MFYYCPALEHIYVSYCTDWTTYLPSSVRAQSTFYQCTKLPNWDGTTTLSRARIGTAGYFEKIGLYYYHTNTYSVHFSNFPRSDLYKKWIPGRAEDGGSVGQYSDSVW